MVAQHGPRVTNFSHKRRHEQRCTLGTSTWLYEYRDGAVRIPSRSQAGVPIQNCDRTLRLTLDVTDSSITLFILGAEPASYTSDFEVAWF